MSKKMKFLIEMTIKLVQSSAACLMQVSSMSLLPEQFIEVQESDEEISKNVSFSRTIYSPSGTTFAHLSDFLQITTHPKNY